MRESKEFRAKLGRRLHGKLEALAGHWEMPMTEYVRNILLKHVQEAEIPKSEEEENYYGPLGA